MEAAIAQNCAIWQWDRRRERAALLLAENALNNKQIAAKIGVSQRTLDYWKRAPEFQQRIQQHVEAFRQKVLTTGFADKINRIHLLDSMAMDISKQIRDADYQREEVKLAANGEHVTYQVFDRERVESVRGLLADLAKEVGDREGAEIGRVNVQVNMLNAIAPIDARRMLEERAG